MLGLNDDIKAFFVCINVIYYDNICVSSWHRILHYKPYRIINPFGLANDSIMSFSLSRIYSYSRRK